MVNTVDKETKYRELIQNVQQSYPSHSDIEKQLPQHMILTLISLILPVKIRSQIPNTGMMNPLN